MSKSRIVSIGFLFVLMIYSIVVPWRSIPEHNIETDYGLPFIWGTKILTEEGIFVHPNETFVLVDRAITRETWRVNLTHLLFDILFWSGLIAIAAIFPTKMPKLRIPRIRIAIEFQDGAEREICPKDGHQ